MDRPALLLDVVRSDAPILLLEEMAALLRVEPDWLQRSTCPRIREGGIVRYDREAGLRWFRARLTPKLEERVA